MCYLLAADSVMDVTNNLRELIPLIWIELTTGFTPYSSATSAATLAANSIASRIFIRQ
ncbi:MULTISPECIES: hypothetical protein [unclassified Coleofasciculus]|uniref:hypothetical protein n=1 Tax=unclassified Coleofasciculus TaxID=2692782 RepID=UPI00187EDF55|nr:MULTISPECIES: hypothetical protein [unclassified Coleofasciculus]MBE9147763.1 hypothetical protein [Coleofasciculus sp. LEGE 07092]